MFSLIGIAESNVILKLQILPAINNVICMSINNDATISCSINDKIQFTEKLTYLSVKDPIQLVIDLFGNTRAIEISAKKPKIMSCDTFFIRTTKMKKAINSQCYLRNKLAFFTLPCYLTMLHILNGYALDTNTCMHIYNSFYNTFFKRQEFPEK